MTSNSPAEPNTREPNLDDAADAPLSVVVVGASLAGLTTGLALARIGISVTVLECAPAERPSGAAMSADEAQMVRVLGRDRASDALAPTRATGLSRGRGGLLARRRVSSEPPLNPARDRSDISRELRLPGFEHVPSNHSSCCHPTS